MVNAGGMAWRWLALLPPTGDDSFSPVWIVVAAVAIVGVAVVLRLRNR